MKKINVSIFLMFVLSLAILFSSVSTQKADADDWVTTGSFYKRYWHSGSFSNYVYQRNFTITSYYDTVYTGVKASSSGSGLFKAILQKNTNGVWKNYRTKYASKNGATTLNFSGLTYGATYRIKLENIDSSKITYIFYIMQ